MQRKQYIAITALLVLLSILLTFCITYIALDISHNKDIDEIRQEYKDKLNLLGEFSTIAELYSSLPEEMRNIEMYKKLAYIDYYYRTNYIGELDEDELVYYVANGYITGADDKFGVYYTADDMDTVIGESQGNSVGIGVYVSIDTKTNLVRILYVMKDGPAHKAGMLPGDLVYKIDGESVSELGYYGSIDKIKGEAGAKVKITILRDGKEIELQLTRQKVEIETVLDSQYVDTCGTTDTSDDVKVGVIRVIEFNDAVPNQLKSSIDKLVKAGCKSLVFDMRNNPGGTLTSVVEVLDFLLPKGDLVYIKDASGKVLETHKSNDGKDELTALYGSDIKMAVLVNENTASAAELFTCALKDYERAVIVGTKTYGKGCGQSVIPLPDGSGLSFTSFLYDPPKSKNYNGIGITPDVVVELNDELKDKNLFDVTNEEDNQLNKACEALRNK